MTGPIPTRAGDVLIVWKTGTTVHTVGVVSEDGAQELTAVHESFSSRDEAIREARKLAMASHRIYRKETGSGDWSPV